MPIWRKEPPPEPETGPLAGVDVTSAVQEQQRRVRLERILELRRAHAPIPLEDEDVQIIRCNADCTLFLSQIRRAMTAWRWRYPDRHIGVLYESGFRPAPSEYTTPLDEGCELVSDEIDPLDHQQP